MAERLSIPQVTHQMVVFGLSDQGLQRGNNEDHFMVADLTRKVIGVHENQLRPELFHHDLGIRGTVLMVADGLGGHAGGEIASQMAVDAVAQTLVEAAEPVLPMSEQIIRAVGMAHAAICQHHSASGRTRQMASTLTAVHVGHGVMTVAQVGDSRAYRFSGGKLTLLTDDQTVVHMMQKKGMLTPEEAQNHPHRNIILQALGQDKSVSPEVQTLPFTHNDYLLLCSDGLSSYVAHEHIEAILVSGEDEHELCRHLVEAANAAGGADNVTVLLARLIIKESGRPAIPGRLPVRSAPRVEERVSTNIRPPAASVPWPMKTAPSPGNSPEVQAQRGALTAPLRASGNTRNASPFCVQSCLYWASQTTDLEAGNQWPWGHKPTSSPTSRTPEPVLARAPSLPQDIGRDEHAPAKPGDMAAAVPWDSRVLKAVADSLAEHIGPVAKILVGKAAQQTKNLHELCQALTAQLSTEQERTSFLNKVLRQQHLHFRRP